MPSTSPAQAKLMRAVAHGWKMPGGGGPSRSVARDFMNADQKAKGYAGGGGANYRQRQREAQQQQEGEGTESTILQPSGDQESDRAGLEAIYDRFGNIQPTGMFSGMFRNIGDQAWDRLSALGPWTGGGAQQIPYARPAPSTRTGTDFDEGSIAEEIYNKYGIIDPTWTEYDRTSQAALREDPYAHLGQGDPARAEYEGWDEERAADLAQREAWEQSTAYGGEDVDRDSPHRERLRAHKSKVSDILGGYEGGAVEMQFGGLAQAMQRRQRGSMGRRGSPQMRQAMQRQTGRGAPQQIPGGSRGRPNMRRGNDAVQPNAKMQAMMRAKMGRGRPGGRGMVAPGLRQQQQKQVGLGAPGRVQPGGPGGMPGGQGQMIRPDDARMPGGRAMPFRGFQQKQAMQNRGNVGGNRVGSADQQGGLARAMQKQTGRPPISRRGAFPGRAR